MPNRPQIVMVDTIHQHGDTQFVSDQKKWKMQVNIQIYNNYSSRFLTVAHFVSESAVAQDVLPRCLQYMSDRFGDHVFNPKKIVVNEIDEKVKENVL